MTFLCIFWKHRNLGDLHKTFEKSLPKMTGSGADFDLFRSDVQTHGAERAGFETSKNRSLGNGPNRLESVQGPRKRLGFEVSRAGRPIRAQNPLRAFFCTNQYPPFASVGTQTP